MTDLIRPVKKKRERMINTKMGSVLGESIEERFARLATVPDEVIVVRGKISLK